MCLVIRYCVDNHEDYMSDKLDEFEDRAHRRTDVYTSELVNLQNVNNSLHVHDKNIIW